MTPLTWLLTEAYSSQQVPRVAVVLCQHTVFLSMLALRGGGGEDIELGV